MHFDVPAPTPAASDRNMQGACAALKRPQTRSHSA